jgi:hypothetical protein
MEDRDAAIEDCGEAAHRGSRERDARQPFGQSREDVPLVVEIGLVRTSSGC